MVRQTTPNYSTGFQESKGGKDMGKTECSWTCVHGEQFSDVQYKYLVILPQSSIELFLITNIITIAG